jgi:hypothetical protein
LRYDGKSEKTNALTVSGLHSPTNINKKDGIIFLDDATSDDVTVMSAITLDINDKNTLCYLPVIYNDTKDKSELILLSIDEPHI